MPHWKGQKVIKRQCEDHASPQMTLNSYCKSHGNEPKFLFDIISTLSFYTLVQLEHFWMCWVWILSMSLN